HLSLPDAAALFTLLTHQERRSEGGKMGLYRRENRYGLAIDKRPITPPLFDEAKRLRNGIAKVKLDNCSHRINLERFAL
ncbi:MAG: WG repeat-containing protein, partial [Alistipes sp.]|nr:WG repeat-containing protein [Alistipes sp.]